MEELTEQLKQKQQRVLTLEGHLNSATLSLQTLKEVLLTLLHLLLLHLCLPSYTNICNLILTSQLQERILDLEEERDLLKKSYDSLLERSVFL